MNSGARAVPRLRLKQADSDAKILFWLAAILAAAEQGLKDHDRWLLARASRAGQAEGQEGEFASAAGAGFGPGAADSHGGIAGAGAQGFGAGGAEPYRRIWGCAS